MGSQNLSVPNNLSQAFPTSRVPCFIFQGLEVLGTSALKEEGKATPLFVRETAGQLSWRWGLCRIPLAFHGMTEAFGNLWKIIIFHGKNYYLLIYFFPFLLVKRDMTPLNFASKQECPAWGLGPCGGDRTPFAPQWAIWVGWSKILTQIFVNSQRQTMNWREATSKSYPCDFLTGESPAMAPVICGRTSGSTWPISSP